MTDVVEGRNAAITRLGRTPNPCFLPDATRAVVRNLDAADLESAGVHSLMVNAFHLSRRPGISVINSVGGARHFMGWKRPVWSDSGGFQLYSLIRENSSNGRISDQGFLYFQQDGDRELLTPEKAIANQWRLGSDVLFCLDECTHPNDPRSAQEESVRRTIAWARACKAEFVKRLESSRMDGNNRPLLFGIVQGGAEPDLRKRCAEALLDIGFDGFGFGGWPIDDKGGLVDMVSYVAELVPRELPLHGLGIGRPDNVVAAWRAGYTTFDSALPTRDARRGRLMVARDPHADVHDGPDFFDYVYITDDRFCRDKRPIEETCPCPCCQRYPRAYLHHLFRIDDASAARLATIHNLCFMNRMVAALAGSAARGGLHDAQD